MRCHVGRGRRAHQDCRGNMTFHDTSPSCALHLDAAHFTALQHFLSLSRLLAVVIPLDSSFVSCLVCGRSPRGTAPHPLCAAGAMSILSITARQSWVMLQSPRALLLQMKVAESMQSLHWEEVACVLLTSCGQMDGFYT